MRFNDLLSASTIDAGQVIALRHRPTEPKLNRVLPWLAAERHNLYNAYQQTQGEKLEKSLLGAQYVASFIGHAPTKALFIGLYKIGAHRPLSRDEFWRVPEYAELAKFEMRGFDAGRAVERSHVLWFDMELQPFYSQWKGRLIVDWPPPERSWWRRVHKNDFNVIAISEDSALDRAMPPWNEIDLAWPDLAVMPARWKTAIAQWRGIYLIFDTSDAKSYVGSAYGADNIFGRWTNYASSGHGGNKHLRQRDPSNFQFTILQRVSPDMPADEIIRLEANWKDRLHTRQPFGLNEN